MGEFDYDVLVLGGGTAGTTAAGVAVDAGARTAMVNDGELGGLCILRGCMPTKSMLAAAHAIHEAEQLTRFGARVDGSVVVDFARVMQRKTEHVERFKRAKVAGIKAADYDLLEGRARFVEGEAVEVDGRRVTAARYVIATGSEPSMLPLPGLDDVPVLTSDSVMLEQQPARLLVQGGGAIGLELAQFFARVGTEVLLVNRSPLLSHYDPESGRELHRALEAEPRLELAVPGRISGLRPDGAGLMATIDAGADSREFAADALLMAVGRHAALSDLGLEHVGLDCESGALAHDETMQTANPRVFVAGDATGQCQILHVAGQEGRVAGHNAAGGSPAQTVDRRLSMSMIFTDPPYARVGATEHQLECAGTRCDVGRARFPETGRAITMSTEFGLWKLIVDPATREILGTTILGPRADDLAHIVLTMMFHHGTVEQILGQPWYHPTLSEVMLHLARELGVGKGPDV